MPRLSKVKKAFTCPTCAAAYAVLRAGRVPAAAADKIAFSRSVRDADMAVKGGVAAGYKTAKKVKKGIRKANELGPYLEKANQKARKKNKEFKKGWNQTRVMREAWRLKRKDER